MQRVNTYTFYELGVALKDLSQLHQGQKLKEVWSSLFWAQVKLEPFINDKIIPLTVSKASGIALLNALSDLVPLDHPLDDPDRELGYEHYTISQKVQEFVTVLNAELQTLNIYSVSQKGIYSTPELIEKAENIFTETVREIMPEQAKIDIRQAGRCLAFELATAAGFHILRAIEAVLVEYILELTGSHPKDSERNWGAYTRILDKNGGDKKVCSVLDQIRELHRNPTIHPEVVLGVDEALTLLGIAQSLIVAMTKEIQKLKKVKATSEAANDLSNPGL